MAIEQINGVGIFVQDFGAGDSLVLVHGSWADHMSWPLVVPGFASRFRVTVYDRRGHSQSERPEGQGSVREDALDLAGIIERSGAPAHVVGNSMGASISLRLAAERPDLIRTLAVHEPPLFDLMLDDPATRPMAETFSLGITPEGTRQLGDGAMKVAKNIEEGNPEQAARMFVEMVVGEGAWERDVPDVAKQVFINNASTFLDEMRDPESLTVDLQALSQFEHPVLLSRGSESPPLFGYVLDRLAGALPNPQRMTIGGAGHVPHVSHPQQYVEAISRFIDDAG